MKSLKQLKIATNALSFISQHKLRLFSILLCFILLLCQIIWSCHKVFAADNFIAIPNAGFESTAQKSFFGTVYNYPTSWTLSSVYSVDISTDHAISGNSVKINKNSTFTLESEKFSVSSAGEFYFGCHCYAESDSMEIVVKVNVLDSSGNVNQSITSQAYQIPADSWQTVYVDTSISQASDLKIIITTLNPNTACYIDEVFAKEKAKQSSVSTLDGATMRLNINNPGIRFRGSVDKEFYDQCVKNYSDVSAGMLFTVKNNLQGLSDFTVEELSKNNKVYKEITAAIWNNADTIDSDGFYGFNCAIVNIKDHNIDKTYCARSYVKYKDNGVVKYVYGEFSYSNNARTIIEIANAALESNQTFSDKIIEILEHFAFYEQSN